MRPANCKNPLCNAVLPEHVAGRRGNAKRFCNPRCGEIYRALRLVAPGLIILDDEVAIAVIYKMAEVE